jgi:hypothetical protein
MMKYTESLEEIAFKHGLLIDEVIELFRDPTILAHIPAVKALQEEVERLNALSKEYFDKMNEWRSEYEKLEAQLAGGESVSWQPIETVPVTKDEVLAYSRNGNQWMVNGLYLRSQMQEYPGFYTHWRPLLAPPSDTPTQSVSANQPDSGKHVCPEHCMRIPEFCPECSAAPVDSVEAKS